MTLSAQKGPLSSKHCDMERKLTAYGLASLYQPLFVNDIALVSFLPSFFSSGTQVKFWTGLSKMN